MGNGFSFLGAIAMIFFMLFVAAYAAVDRYEFCKEVAADHFLGCFLR